MVHKTYHQDNLTWGLHLALEMYIFAISHVFLKHPVHSKTSHLLWHKRMYFTYISRGYNKWIQPIHAQTWNSVLSLQFTLGHRLWGMKPQHKVCINGAMFENPYITTTWFSEPLTHHVTVFIYFSSLYLATKKHNLVMFTEYYINRKVFCNVRLYVQWCQQCTNKKQCCFLWENIACGVHHLLKAMTSSWINLLVSSFPRNRFNIILMPILWATTFHIIYLKKCKTFLLWAKCIFYVLGQPYFPCFVLQ
jgi:hypothetical protein